MVRGGRNRWLRRRQKRRKQGDAETEGEGRKEGIMFGVKDGDTENKRKDSKEIIIKSISFLQNLLGTQKSETLLMLAD